MRIAPPRGDARNDGRARGCLSRLDPCGRDVVVPNTVAIQILECLPRVPSSVSVGIRERLAVPEQVYILCDASVKALIVEQAFAPIVAPLEKALPDVRIVGLDYAPANGASLAALLEAASGDGRNPHVDTSSPLLIVYTSGTTGHPKGAVLRQEALVWNALMSQHMHDMTAQDHVLTFMRRLYLDSIEAVQQGRDPKHIIRDAAQNAMVYVRGAEALEAV